MDDHIVSYAMDPNCPRLKAGRTYRVMIDPDTRTWSVPKEHEIDAETAAEWDSLSLDEQITHLRDIANRIVGEYR